MLYLDYPEQIGTGHIPTPKAHINTCICIISSVNVSLLNRELKSLLKDHGGGKPCIVLLKKQLALTSIASEIPNLLKMPQQTCWGSKQRAVIILHCKLVHLLDMFSTRYSPAFVLFCSQIYSRDALELSDGRNSNLVPYFEFKSF
jgi:hypothetical protein